MTLKISIATALLTLAVAPLAALAQEKPAKAGICAACHGPTGAQPIMPVYPKLAGQNKEYLESSLKSYRAGQRKGGMAAVMNAQAKNLSDEDISALSAFYAAQECK